MHVEAPGYSVTPEGEAHALHAGPKPVLIVYCWTGNLDEAMGERIVDLMRELNAAEGATFAIVSHNPRVAERADRIVQLRNGTIAGASGEMGGEAAPHPVRRGSGAPAPDPR